MLICDWSLQSRGGNKVRKPVILPSLDLANRVEKINDILKHD